MMESKKEGKKGTIYVVATPIGNLQDFSPRAKQILSEVDLIAAEDTRHSQSLLTHFNISTPLTSYHEHNEEEKTEILLAKVHAGANIAIISDAGTPLISDPGYRIVAQAIAEQIKVVPVPGPCAAIAALSAAGVASDKFLFIGFLPAKTSHRKQELKEYQDCNNTMICYESTHRILDSLADIDEIMPKRQLTIARELTKTFETILHGTAAELRAKLLADPNQQKGEFVLIFAPTEKIKVENKIEVSTTNLLEALLQQLPLKQAVQVAAKISGIRKNILYEQALAMKG